MLTIRKKIQILLYPKIFNVLSFYSKGQYTVHISVVQQTADGQLHYAKPSIVENSDRKIHQNKKPSIKVEKERKQCAFISEQFFITYNEQSVALHTLVLFTLEIDPSAATKTYINFKLVLNRFKTESGNVSSGLDPDLKASSSGSAFKATPKAKILIDVDKRKVFINNILDLDQYKRVVFSQCEYFSYLDVYIGSCYLGTRFRLQKYQLFQFQCMSDKQRNDNHMICSNVNKQLTTSDRATCLAKAVNLPWQQFRVKLSSQLQSTYSQLRRRIFTMIKLFEEENVPYENLNQVKLKLSHQINIQMGIKTKEQLQKYYKTQIQEQLYLQIYKQMLQFDNYIMFAWKIFTKLMSKISYKVFSQQIMRCVQKDYAIKQRNMIVNLKVDSGVRKLEHSNFLKRRKQVISDMKLYDEQDMHHPFIMLENYQKPLILESIPGSQITSLVIFIHGYQGSDYDLEKAKNFLSIYCPASYGLMIKSIQDQIDENIEHLGQRVAQQIKAHITGSINNYRKISLLGYSLGGVIAREVVKHLSELKSKMNLLVTFASPHLGVSMSDNQLVKTGIWYLINFEKVKNLKQLNCEKCIHEESDQFFLNKLSQSDQLSWFKKMIVVSSEQDNFVPHYSARISGVNKSQSIEHMANNILNKVKKLQRMQVWFDVEHDINTFDKMLGRRAHIQFLQNRVFLDNFFRLYGSQF